MPILSYLIQQLQHQRFVILQGATATGKSYWAHKLALESAAQNNYNRSYAQLGPVEQDLLLHEQQGLVRVCRLHPGFTYHQFVEGYRWEMAQGQSTQVLRHGVFKRLCEDARAHPQQAYYLILEDMHQVSLTALLGEVYSLLDPHQTPPQRIYLAQSQESFFIPSNIYLIGTARNRSFTDDEGLFRRFVTLRLAPDYSVLAGMAPGGLKLDTWLEALNQRLRKLKIPLEIGQGYFFESGTPIETPAAFTQVFWHQLLPFLESQLPPEQLHRVLGDPLYVLLDNHQHKALLIPGESELFQALHKTFPEAFGD